MVRTSVSLPPGLPESLTLSFPGPAVAGEPLALLSLASAGDMKFADPRCVPNRERFLRGAGFDPSQVLGLNLIHSRRVLFPLPGTAAGVGGIDAVDGIDGADGIILGDPGLAATVTVADCLPIWILDRGSGAFGLLHSGWRGTGILRTALLGMIERFGTRPSSVALILGPAIGPCCYAVSAERAGPFAAEFGESSVSLRGGSFFLDLRLANIALAESLGIGQLLSVEACTCCDERLGSFRRQGQQSFTRMLALCGRAASR